MRSEDCISADRLRILLDYNPDTGRLFWKYRDISLFVSEVGFRMWNPKNAGKEAFTSTNVQGYKQGSIKPHVFLAHRVVWAVYYGEWPSLWVDHINTVKTDNRIQNLRLCTPSQNGMNRGAQSNNTSGYKGVFYNRRDDLWEAKICIDGVSKNLGRFASKDMAAECYDAAAVKYHDDFCRNNGVVK